jgi:hypothetical protein
VVGIVVRTPAEAAFVVVVFVCRGGWEDAPFEEVLSREADDVFEHGDDDGPIGLPREKKRFGCLS